MTDIDVDVVVVGAGGAGLPAAITARDHGASVAVIEANDDVGGHAILSGGNIRLGGGTRWQQRHGIEDSADRLYLEHTDHEAPEFRRSDRDLVRVWADENVATFEFLLENNVVFRDAPPIVLGRGSTPRVFSANPSSDDWNDSINGAGGSGVVRPLENSARTKGVDFRLGHRLTEIVREPGSGRVTGVSAEADGRTVRLRARRGVVLATGGHTSNVELRRLFDARLTDEYQTAGEPWTSQTGDGELLAMDIGASLWGVGIQAAEYERQATLPDAPTTARGGTSIITKSIHIGCQWGYRTLKWHPSSPVFPKARASGLTVRDFQDLILVNQVGKRFWNELDDSTAFVNACLGTNGSLGRDGKTNGGGPIWAIFDASAVRREDWIPEPPHVDRSEWFFSAGSIRELAAAIANPYQRHPIAPDDLEETVDRYNAFVAQGSDLDFGRPSPLRALGADHEDATLKSSRLEEYQIRTPPFYAAWATPILHDTVTGLRIDRSCRVLDLRGRTIEGLFAAGETAGGFGLHGLGRAIVFGRIAGRSAALG